MPSTVASKKAPQTRVKRAASVMTATAIGGSFSPATFSTLIAYIDEDRPIGPVVHAGSRALICDTFPPVKKPIHFYYPNKNNNTWRVLGNIFYCETSYFYTRTAVASGDSKIMTCNLNEANIRHFAGSAPVGFLDVCS